MAAKMLGDIEDEHSGMDLDIVDEDWGDDMGSDADTDEESNPFLMPRPRPMQEEGYPERLLLHLPSHFTAARSNTSHFRSMVKKEIALRVGQANDCLQSIRLGIRNKSFTFRGQMRVSKYKKQKTRTWDTIHALDNGLGHHRRIYGSQQYHSGLQCPWPAKCIVGLVLEQWHLRWASRQCCIDRMWVESAMSVSAIDLCYSLPGPLVEGSRKDASMEGGAHSHAAWDDLDNVVFQIPIKEMEGMGGCGGVGGKARTCMLCISARGNVGKTCDSLFRYLQKRLPFLFHRDVIQSGSIHEYHDSESDWARNIWNFNKWNIIIPR